MLLAVLGLNAFLLRHDLAFAHDVNDNVAHWSLIQRIEQQIQTGGSPFDAWSSESAGGFPVLRDYQIGAHLLVVAVYHALFKAVPLWTCFSVIRWLAIVLLPLGFWCCARLLRMSDLECGYAALLAPWISTPGLYGLEYNSYIWGGNGSGMFTMAAATFGLLAAIGWAYRAAFEQRMKQAVALGILIGVTAWCHWFLGWMAAMTAVLFAVVAFAKTRTKQPLVSLCVAGAVAFVFLAPRIYNVWTDWGILNASRFEPAWKTGGFGWERVIGGFLAGSFLDYGRPAILTILSLVGITLCAYRWREGRAFVLLCGAALWLLISCGTVTFPAWLLVPLGAVSGMPIHRAIAGAEIFLILLAALGMAWVVELIRRRWRSNVAAALAVLLLLTIPVIERARSLVTPTLWGEQSRIAFQQEGQMLDASLKLAVSTGGRVYAGKVNDWGHEFKIGQTPVWAELTSRLIPNVGYSYFPQNLPTDTALNFNDKDPLWYRVFNVTAVISPEGTAGPWIFPMGHFGRFIVWRVVASPGYFEVVNVTQMAKTDGRGLYDVTANWMQQRQADLGNYWLVDIGMSKEAVFMPPVGDGLPGQVSKQDETSARVVMSRWGWLLYKVTWHPGWRAMVDGVAAQTVMLTPGFIGIPLGAGNYHVEMRYGD